MNPKFRIAVLSTGMFSAGVLDFVQQIYAKTYPLCVLQIQESDSWDQAKRKVEEGLLPLKDVPLLVLTDLIGSTSYNLAEKVVEGWSGCHVVGGMNLPLIVKGLQMTEELDLDEALPVLLDYARAHMGSRGMAEA